jgi:hypothetical protein
MLALTDPMPDDDAVLLRLLRFPTKDRRDPAEDAAVLRPRDPEEDAAGLRR